MLRNLLALPVAGALLLGASAASAQEFGFDQGDWTLSLAGQGANGNDFDGFTASADARIGYFVADNLELNVRQALIFSDIGGSNWNGATALGADYFFDLDRWQPFVGAFIGYRYGDSTDDTFVAGPEVGVRYMVNQTTYITGLVAYEFLFEDEEDADEGFEDGIFTYSLGIGFKF